ncbi:MAG TPA: hypothetical protein VIK78_19830 [Ruminiclostridium sp.]
MKHGNSNFMELSRLLFTEPYNKLSQNAKWLFVTLNELEQRYTGTKEEDYFFRSNEDLSKDSGLSLPTLKRAKKELLQSDLVYSWQMHFNEVDTNKKSKLKVTAYRILK